VTRATVQEKQQEKIKTVHTLYVHVRVIFCAIRYSLCTRVRLGQVPCTGRSGTDRRRVLYLNSRGV